MYLCLQGRKGRSVADIQRSLARKRKAISRGLPDWGKDLPDDVSMQHDTNISQHMQLEAETCDSIPYPSLPPSPQFFDRLELFKEESIRKQEELIDRIRKEVWCVCVCVCVWRECVIIPTR